MTYNVIAVEKQNFLQLDNIKNYLRISHDYDDQWITELISGAIAAAEGFLRMKLLATNIKYEVKSAHGKIVLLQVRPVESVIAIKALTSNGYITLQQDEYIILGDIIKLRPHSAYEYLTIEYIAGYKEQSKIPAPIKQGIMLHIAEMYDSRGTTASISNEVRTLYQPYRQMML